ncbi:uncharacterized protein B0H64DRAFT_31848 [Chaetomium fimeti]|uniref:Uncharacterized protein n=1 Tax=Chaetomium fimeti TaxID=1854472 RepID=A0AAE0HQZ9_9PEZI|nr:hypothetical protein B0H64DRAFT_31848 [Chaetomium fimeti]
MILTRRPYFSRLSSVPLVFLIGGAGTRWFARPWSYEGLRTQMRPVGWCDRQGVLGGPFPVVENQSTYRRHSTPRCTSLIHYRSADLQPTVELCLCLGLG